MKMKNILLALIILVMSCDLVNSQTFESRLIVNAYGYIEYQMMETSGTNPPYGDPNLWGSYNRPITDITFTVRWSQALGDPLEINLLCTDYNIVEGFPNALTHPSEPYYYKLFGCNPIPVYPPEEVEFWEQGVWQTIATLKITNTNAGIGDFSLAPADWLITKTLNFSYDSDENSIPEDYIPIINSNVANYPYPTFVYNRVWTGAGSTHWNVNVNWIDECGVVATAVPNATSNVLIPSGATNLCSTWNGTTGNPLCKNLTIGEGGYLSVPTTKTLTVSGTTRVKADGQFILASGSTSVSTKANLDTLIAEVGALRAPGTIIINPDAWITCTGPTTIAAPQQLKILADINGVGSFKDNGIINYGASGSALIETYLSNSGTYYFHQVGPTVDNLSSGSGVPLGDFDIAPLNTFAYEWDEPNQEWVNQSLESYGVNTGNGLMLTTNNGASGEYGQEGTLINSNVTLNLALSGDPTPELSTYGWNLKSNPYAMALDWQLVWTREDAALVSPNDLNPTVYVLDNGTSNYRSYNAFTGLPTTNNTRYIQIGQGFWLQYLTSPYTVPNSINITLQPGDRVHSMTPFLKDEIAYNQVTLTAEGNNSIDELIIAFRDFGTPGYDKFIDVDKWDSYFEDATEIWTLTNDQHRLTHNVQSSMEESSQLSVPMTFKCASAGTYAIKASEIESFEGGVDVFLEDLITGGEWYDLVENPTYTFEVSETGIQSRFIVHFFNTTGVEDIADLPKVRIYAWGQDAYIINRGKETIKEYVAYDMMGRELHRGTLPNSTVNKVTIGDVSAYYIIKVITKEGRIYNEKVYITK